MEADSLPSTRWSQIGTFFLAILPPVLFLRYTSWHWIIAGSSAWILALPLKCLLSALVQYLPWKAETQHLRRQALGRAALLGGISAITELGVAGGLLVLLKDRLGNPGWVEIVGFAAGGGCTEILLLQGVVLLDRCPTKDENVTRWTHGARASGWVRNMFLVERLVALLGQIASRCLLSLSIKTAALAPGVCALIGFAFTDGLATYETLQGCDYFQPSQCKAFYRNCALIVLCELLALAFFLR